MAYTMPTAEEFLARFPAFSDVDEGYITSILTNEVDGRYVDDSWLDQKDFTSGALYAAAHLIATDRSQEGEAVDTGDAAIASENWGSMGVTYAKGAAATTTTLSGFAATTYGQRYLELLRATKPAIVAI